MPSSQPPSSGLRYLLEALLLVVLIAVVVVMTQLILMPSWRYQATEFLRALVN
jgi:hypothetical protein